MKMPLLSPAGPRGPGHAGHGASAPPSRYRSSKTGTVAGILALILLSAFFGAAVPVLGIIVPLAALLLAFLMWVLVDFRIGAGLAIVLMPMTPLAFFPREMFGIRGLNPVNVVLFLTLLSYLVHAGLRRWRDPLVPRRLVLWYILPFAIASLVGLQYVSLIPSRMVLDRVILFTDGAGYLRDLFFKPLFYILLALLVALQVRHSKKPERVIFLMLISGWVLCLVMGWLMLSSGVSMRDLASPQTRSFMSKIGMHANEMSLMLNSLYALTLFSIREQAPGVLKHLLFVSAMVFAVAVLLTFSRGGMLGLVLINAIYFWKRISVKTVAIGLLVVACIGPFVAEPLIDRLLTGFEKGDRGAVTAGRLDDIWLPLMPTVLEQPLFPNGLSSMLWSSPIRLNRMLPVGHAHSAWLGGVMDMGLIGLAFVIAFLLFVRREFLRLSQSHSASMLQGFFAGGAALIPVWFLQGVTDDRFTPTPSQVYIWIAVGVLIGCGGLYHERKKRGPRVFPMPPARESAPATPAASCTFAPPSAPLKGHLST